MIEREGDQQYENAVCYEKYNATTTTNNINNEKRASEECESAGHHSALHTYIHFD